MAGKGENDPSPPTASAAAPAPTAAPAAAGQGKEFILSAVSDAERVLLELKIRNLGGVIKPNITTTFTHLVLGTLECNAKCLCALAGGRWVVLPSFVHDSAAAGAWVSEAPHEWRPGCAAKIDRKFSGLLPQPSFWRQRRENTQRGAFQLWKVFWPLEGRATKEHLRLEMADGSLQVMHSFRAALLVGGASFIDTIGPHVSHVFPAAPCPGLLDGTHRCFDSKMVCDYLTLGNKFDKTKYERKDHVPSAATSDGAAGGAVGSGRPALMSSSSSTAVQSTPAAKMPPPTSTPLAFATPLSGSILSTPLVSLALLSPALPQTPSLLPQPLQPTPAHPHPPPALAAADTSIAVVPLLSPAPNSDPAIASTTAAAVAVAEESTDSPPHVSRATSITAPTLSPSASLGAASHHLFHIGSQELDLDQVQEDAKEPGAVGAGLGTGDARPLVPPKDTISYPAAPRVSSPLVRLGSLTSDSIGVVAFPTTSYRTSAECGGGDSGGDGGGGGDIVSSALFELPQQASEQKDSSLPSGVQPMVLSSPDPSAVGAKSQSSSVIGSGIPSESDSSFAATDPMERLGVHSRGASSVSDMDVDDASSTPSKLPPRTASLLNSAPPLPPAFPLPTSSPVDPPSVPPSASSSTLSSLLGAENPDAQATSTKSGDDATEVCNTTPRKRIALDQIDPPTVNSLPAATVAAASDASSFATAANDSSSSPAPVAHPPAISAQSQASTPSKLPPDAISDESPLLAPVLHAHPLVAAGSTPDDDLVDALNTEGPAYDDDAPYDEDERREDRARARAERERKSLEALEGEQAKPEFFVEPSIIATLVSPLLTLPPPPRRHPPRVLPSTTVAIIRSQLEPDTMPSRVLAGVRSFMCQNYALPDVVQRYVLEMILLRSTSAAISTEASRILEESQRVLPATLKRGLPWILLTPEGDTFHDPHSLGRDTISTIVLFAHRALGLEIAGDDSELQRAAEARKIVTAAAAAPRKRGRRSSRGKKELFANVGLDDEAGDEDEEMGSEEGEGGALVPQQWGAVGTVSELNYRLALMHVVRVVSTHGEDGRPLIQSLCPHTLSADCSAVGEVVCLASNKGAAGILDCLQELLTAMLDQRSVTEVEMVGSALHRLYASTSIVVRSSILRSTTHAPLLSYLVHSILLAYASDTVPHQARHWAQKPLTWEKLCHFCFFLGPAGRVVGNVAEEQAFLIAARAGNVAKITDLLRRGVNIDVVDEDGRTALMWAVKGRHYDAVTCLLNAGCGVNRRDLSGSSAFLEATTLSDHKMAGMLMSRGAAVAEGSADTLVRVYGLGPWPPGSDVPVGDGYRLLRPCDLSNMKEYLLLLSILAGNLLVTSGTPLPQVDYQRMCSRLSTHLQKLYSGVAVRGSVHVAMSLLTSLGK